jgi:hypothetical protein
MLAAKGDTRGQKDQIVNELVRVHQRFQARMNEYNILIRMTIEFFKNVSQVCGKHGVDLCITVRQENLSIYKKKTKALNLSAELAYLV